MRRMILTTLVLLPVMAHAQATTSTEPQPSTSSATLHAELTKPANLAAMTKSAAPIASIAAISTQTHAAVREAVDTRVTENFVDSAMRAGGTLEYAMMGS